MATGSVRGTSNVSHLVMPFPYARVAAPVLVNVSLAVTPMDVAFSQGQPWRQYATPEDAGFSHALLEHARRHADSVRSAAVMVVYRGHVLAAWGDVARELELHSVRKSMVGMLYGTAVDRGAIDLDRTLGDIGLDDRTPLTETEKTARIRDLLAARSGVYLPSAYAARDQEEERPPRGSQAPGTHFFYNNWDFNVAGVLYERLVEPDLYAAFARRLAEPLGMEDFTAADGFKVYEPSGSIHPAHTMRMSTRDLARVGQLCLQGGEWNGRRIVSSGWIARSTRAASDFGNGTGYGYLWWTYAAGSLGARYPALSRYEMYAARGTGGQFLLVIPGAELVFVHRGDTDNGREVRGADVWRIAELVLSARTGKPRADLALTGVQPVTFASQAPPRPRRMRLELSLAQQTALSGQYAVSPEVTITVFTFEGRLFANFPGQGEAELLGTTTDEFTIMPDPGVMVRFLRDAAGHVTGVRARIGAREFTAARR